MATSSKVAFKVTTPDYIPRFDWKLLQTFQGNLKDLSTENFDKLAASIEEHGWFLPLALWNNGKVISLMDGHQRIRYCETKEKAGFTIPKLPAFTIEARTKKEAKQKLLLINSAYGTLNKQGLYEYMVGEQIDPAELVSKFAIPQIDALKFLDEFFTDLGAIEPLPPVTGNLGSVGGNGVKMLQLFYTEKDHAQVLSLIQVLQSKFGTENATDTVLQALKHANN